MYIGSAFIAVCLSAAHLVLTISNSEDANPIDRFIYKAAKVMIPFQICASKRDFWVPVIEKLVLSLSDQQLLTGLAVLIAAFWTHCTISVYHFAVVNDLAWFSAMVHLITLTVLRDYLLQKPVLRNWRVVLMSTLAILLAASTVMEGHYLWYDGGPYDAQCLFDELIGNVNGSPKRWMLANLVLICINYPLSIIPLFKRPTVFVKHWLGTKPTAALEEAVEHLTDTQRTCPKSFKGSIKCLTCKLLILIVRVVTWTHFAISTLIGSRTFDFVLNTAWFAVGLWSVFTDRNIPSSDMVGDENALTFGQIMPILLLSSLVLVFREAYDGT